MMLAPLLAVEDPYAAASIFSLAGWKLEYETARAGSQPQACVSLALARIVLVSDQAEPADLRRGLGVELQISVPPHELSGLFLLHRAAGLALTDPAHRPPTERGFTAEIVGYRFSILAGEPDPDLALIATDPRVAALADGLRQRDGTASLTDTALRMVEGSGESVRSLRHAMREGLSSRHRHDVGEELAEVVIAAAILARQLGVDLDQQIEAKLGSPTWRSRN